ncbi:heparinase II/III family protein [Brevibacterium luteolum]|uniref:heparinase II/III domain-containing protein n=1 Tax=Brevibacterium luteolum TaxID=199591 RepID=UPI003879465D
MFKLIYATYENYLLASIPDEGVEYSFYLLHEGEVLERRMRLPHGSAWFRIEPGREYRVKGFLVTGTGAKSSRTSDPVSIAAPEDRVVPLSWNEISASGIWDLLAETTPDSIASIVELANRGQSATTVLEDLRVADARPTGWFNLKKVRGSIAHLKEEGWIFQRQAPIHFENEIPWGLPVSINRTWAYELHAWRFIDPILKDCFDNPGSSSVTWLMDIIRSWWNYANAESTISRDNMVWYDMAASLRTARLLRAAVISRQQSSIEDTMFLIRVLVEHLKFTASDESFNSATNHGFYSAACALDAARLVPVLSQSFHLQQIGRERMDTMIRRQFAPDGGHLEHSPDYHRMLLGSFEAALDDGLIRDEELTARIALAADVLGWMVQPNGEIVQFGDSPATPMVGPGRKSTSPHTEFILTDGRSGDPTADEMRTLQSTGYAFVRCPQPNRRGELGNSSYLAFNASHHSRAHKHADDLSFVWYDCGRELLIDSGRFGYIDLLPPDHPDRKKGFYYGSPERQYVESTLSHNTLAPEGENLARTTQSAYGSGLGRCFKAGSIFTIQGEVAHRGYRHARVLNLDPRNTLEVRDTVTAESPQTVISWFNLPGDFELSHRDGILVFSSNEKTLHLTVSTSEYEGIELVPPARGCKAPLRGWRSKQDGELEACWNFGFRWYVEGQGSLSVRFTIRQTLEWDQI